MQLNFLIIFFQLKLNANSNCKNKKKGYALYLNGEGKFEADKNETKLKYFISVWLFVSAITFAGILYCGRYFKSVAIRLEKMIEDSVGLFLAIVDIFRIFGKLNKLLKTLKTLLSDKKGKTNEKEEKRKEAKGTDKVEISESTDKYEEIGKSETAPFILEQILVTPHSR